MHLPTATIRTQIMLPLRFADGFGTTARVYSFDGLADGREHLALVDREGDALGRRAERVQLGSRVESADPRLEVALAHASGRAIEPGHGRRGRPGDHERPGDPGGG